MLIAEESIEKHIWDEQTHMVTFVNFCLLLLKMLEQAWKRREKQKREKEKEKKKERRTNSCYVWLITERKRDTCLLLVFILIKKKNENPKGKSFFSSIFLIFSASRLRLPSNDNVEGYISKFQQNEIINKHQFSYLEVIKGWQAHHYLELKVFLQELKLKI